MMWRYPSNSPTSKASPGSIDFAPDAFRFLNGTPDVTALYSARTGCEIVNQIGVEAIRAKSIRQTQRLIELADEAGIPVRSCREAAPVAAWLLSTFRMEKKSRVSSRG